MVTKSVVKVASKPMAKYAAKSLGKPAAKPVAKPAAKPAVKPAAKRAVKPVAKPAAKAAAKPAARAAARPAARVASKPASLSSSDSEFSQGKNGFFLPKNMVAVAPTPVPVPSNKLIAGITKAREDMQETLHAISEAFIGDFDVAEIEISASFDVKGAFLGFGVGGAASIKIKLKPKA